MVEKFLVTTKGLFAGVASVDITQISVDEAIKLHEDKGYKVCDRAYEDYDEAVDERDVLQAEIDVGVKEKGYFPELYDAVQGSGTKKG